jgi:hypothetical protein
MFTALLLVMVAQGVTPEGNPDVGAMVVGFMTPAECEERLAQFKAQEPRASYQCQYFPEQIVRDALTKLGPSPLLPPPEPYSGPE